MTSNSGEVRGRFERLSAAIEGTAVGSRHFFGFCILLIGAIWIISGSYVSLWQPLPESVPGLASTARIAGFLFLISGAALLSSRLAPYAAIIPIPIFLLFVGKWATRILLLPAVAGTWSGCAEELVPILGAVLIVAGNRNDWTTPSWIVAACRIAFGLCAISFGLVHFEALQQTAAMVPGWIPGSGRFWAVATGLVHAFGGIALVLNARSQLAARLLATMYLIFELTIWLPSLWSHVFDAVVWTGNAVTLIEAAAALVLAHSIVAQNSGERIKRA